MHAQGNYTIIFSGTTSAEEIKAALTPVEEKYELEFDKEDNLEFEIEEDYQIVDTTDVTALARLMIGAAPTAEFEITGYADYAESDGTMYDVSVVYSSITDADGTVRYVLTQADSPVYACLVDLDDTDELRDYLNEEESEKYSDEELEEIMEENQEIFVCEGELLTAAPALRDPVEVNI